MSWSCLSFTRLHKSPQHSATAPSSAVSSATRRVASRLWPAATKSVLEQGACLEMWNCQSHVCLIIYSCWNCENNDTIWLIGGWAAHLKIVAVKATPTTLWQERLTCICANIHSDNFWHMFRHLSWNIYIIRYLFLTYLLPHLLASSGKSSEILIRVLHCCRGWRSGARSRTFLGRIAPVSRDRPVRRWPDTFANHKMSNAEERVPVLHLAMPSSLIIVCHVWWLKKSWQLCIHWQSLTSLTLFSGHLRVGPWGSIGFKSPGFICWKGTWSRHVTS